MHLQDTTSPLLLLKREAFYLGLCGNPLSQTWSENPTSIECSASSAGSNQRGARLSCCWLVFSASASQQELLVQCAPL